MLSMSSAATQAGVSKATIHRAIKSGKLSATRRDDGSYEIDPAELFRVYAPGKRLDPTSMRRAETPDETANAAALEAENRLLRERVDELKADRDELKVDRDAWRQQAERLALSAPTTNSGFLGLFRRR